MNHHYPENYHGYVRGAAGMQNMGYGHGVYEDQMTMGHMGHSRTNYQMSHYRDNGQMHPMMQQQQSNMYPAGYMNQAGSGSYGMGGYSNYGMANQANMMMGPRNVMGRYYNHPLDSRNSQHAPAASPNSTFTQNTVGNSLHCQSPMNRMPTNQNCSQSQTGALQGVQVSHCASPHTLSTTHSNSGFQGQGSSINHALISNVEGQQRPVAGNMPASSMHSIPQHPMRQPTTQQNPQEVADNILQIASSYPANQTVQVPLKSRHAPYHIPRSPHYNMPSSDHSHPSPMASHSQQPSPAPQPSPTPSTSSVKSPTPSLAPIPNPIPSPGVAGLRSPSNQGATSCGNQRSPALMASNFSGHSQPSPSPHHYSPTGIGNQQNFSSFAQSPPASRIMPTSFPPPNDPNMYPNTDISDMNSYSSPLPSSASPHSHSIMSEPPSSNTKFNQQGNGNNPLMSLQKLVMLPETQVVDPKSVVNDACLSSQSIENDEVPKNVEDPAEGCAKSSHSSVGSSGQSSSNISQSAEQAQVCTEAMAKASDSNDPSLLEKPADNCAVNENDTPEKNPEKSPKALENGEANCQEDKLEMPSSPHLSTILDSESENKVSSISTEESDGINESKSVSRDIEKSQENFTELTKEKKPQSPEPNDITMKVKSECVKDCDLDEQNSNVLHSLNPKNGKVNGLNEDVKKSMKSYPCKSPCVLSEVPLLVNGMSASENIDDNVDEGNDNGREFQNGFTPRLRSKLRLGEKSGQFVRLTTPCSIAVGADERALCERFVFRRNDYCHTLRTSRLLCNGRTRQDSTGNGDSDESIENVIDDTFDVIGNPQDGSKKKPSSNPSKKNDMKKPAMNSSSQVSKKDGMSNKGSRLCKANNGHLSNPNELNAEASDEDGDVCYYEGVDSSDFFINNASSDDSISSSQEGKQTFLSSTSPDKKIENLASNAEGKRVSQEKEKDNLNDISSPPSKRTRTMSSQKGQDSVNRKSLSNTIDEDDCNRNEDAKKDSPAKLELDNQISSQPENGKITRSRLSKRKLPAVKEKAHHEQHKLPEVIVRLEKSPIFEENTSLKVEPADIDSPSVKVEKCSTILIEDSSPEKEDEKVSSEISSLPKAESNVEYVKAEEPSCPDKAIHDTNKDNLKPQISDLDDVNCKNPGSSNIQSKRQLTSKKKKPVRKRKKQMPPQANKGRNDEVKSSFKSMKFSRTLDMMKYQKKKDSCYTGPFIRIEGDKNSPKTVSVFNQSSQDLLASTSKHKQTQRQSHSRNVSTTVHMVSNLTNDKTVIVSSTKVLPNKQWSCAFCSHHSSFQSLGDLFGPYFREADLPILENVTSEESKKAESNKDSPKSASISKMLKSQGDKKGQKKKISLKPDQHLPQEIWLHESCALWAPGVYLIGNKIYGLDDAIRDAAETICSVCKGKGAMIGCLYKGCAMKYHFACAIEKECHLDEANFSLLCPKHKDKKLNTASSSSSSAYFTQKKS